jgi:hypothetical protein
MLCHTRSLRDSRREKRQHTVGSSTALNTADGSGAPTETNEGASAEDSAPDRSGDHDAAVDDRRVPDIDDSVVFDDPTVEDDSAARGGNHSRREWLPAELRIENEALRAENEALRQRLAAGGGSPPSVPVSMPEPRRVDDMMSDGERKVTSPMQGAVEVFFPESEAPDRDREPTPVNCFNASQSMYIGDAWSAEIVQAYRERVAAQGGFDAGPLTETADKQKIFWRNVWFFTRMVVLFSFLLWSIAWHIESAALHGGEWHYPLFALLYVFATVWAYAGKFILMIVRAIIMKSRVFCQQGIATYSRTDAWRSRTANVNAKKPSPWRRPGCEQRTIGRERLRFNREDFELRPDLLDDLLFGWTAA